MKIKWLILGLLLTISGITYLNVSTVIASATPASVNAKPMFNLDSYKWKNRLLLVFADDSNSVAYNQQMQLLENQTGLAESDLLIVQLLAQGTSHLNKYTIAPVTVTQLRTQFNLPAGFALILLGKDGTVKRRERTPIAPEVIFNQIDAMPMRQQEMKQL